MFQFHCEDLAGTLPPHFTKTTTPPSSFIMGKKSRKVKARTPMPAGSSGASNEDVVSGTQPACYFCLEEGDDEEEELFEAGSESGESHGG